jgi:hypothetical protein
MKKVKINYILDAVIASAFIISALSGSVFLFMGESGYQGGRNTAFSTAFAGISRASWSDLHLLGSLVMIAGVILHVALHWKWLVCVTKTFIPHMPQNKDEMCEVIA